MSVYYCDIATEFVDDVPTAWCEWSGTEPAYVYRDEFTFIWRCPRCDWEWVVYIDPEEGAWWEDGLRSYGMQPAIPAEDGTK